MARIDYYDIANEIAGILSADSELSGVTVAVESDHELGVGLFVGVYIDRRESPPDEQQISAGTRERYILYVTLLCRAYSLDSISDAIRRRDDLVGKVEIALMGNRTLNGKVGGLWLEGGALPSGKDESGSGYISEGEIIVAARVSAVT